MPPEDITYVEAHGTGTELGDPIELKALQQALDGAEHCAIGSVKGNIGHTTMAAGIAGLLKVLLAIRHRTLPPTINFTSPNPAVDFTAGPVAGHRRAGMAGTAADRGGEQLRLQRDQRARARGRAAATGAHRERRRAGTWCRCRRGTSRPSPGR